MAVPKRRNADAEFFCGILRIKIPCGKIWKKRKFFLQNFFAEICGILNSNSDKSDIKVRKSKLTILII